MKKELGIARCGLACALCSENDRCKGCYLEDCKDFSWCKNRLCLLDKKIDACYKCDNKDCNIGLLNKIKAKAFVEFIRRYSLEKLLECLENNEKKGIVYHRNGITGDYDDFDNIEDLIEFILSGEHEIN